MSTRDSVDREAPADSASVPEGGPRSTFLLRITGGCMPLGDRDYYPDMLARQFRNAREAAGLTQTQAAERLLSDQSEISRLETGERRADPSYSIKSCADSGVWQGNGVVMDGDLTVIN